MTKEKFAQAKKELIEAGWDHILSACCADSGLKYGLLFTKDGSRFYLNKDTYIHGFSGAEMAEVCKPLFNN